MKFASADSATYSCQWDESWSKNLDVSTEQCQCNLAYEYFVNLYSYLNIPFLKGANALFRTNLTRT